jgi:hypothetical protein
MLSRRPRLATAQVSRSTTQGELNGIATKAALEDYGADVVLIIIGDGPPAALKQLNL